MERLHDRRPCASCVRSRWCSNDSLPASQTIATEKKIEEPASGLQFKFTSREFFLDVNSLPTVKPGIYYIPKKKNQPTIDSFIIVHRDFVKKNFPNEAARSNAEYFILFFQVTISRDHVVDGDELNKVKNAAKDKIQIVKGETQQLGVPVLPMIFLFVTEPGGIKTWHYVEENVYGFALI